MNSTSFPFSIFLNSDFFAKECQNFRETFNRVSDYPLCYFYNYNTLFFLDVKWFLKMLQCFQVQQLVSENNTALCQTVLDKSDYLVSTCKYLIYLFVLSFWIIEALSAGCALTSGKFSLEQAVRKHFLLLLPVDGALSPMTLFLTHTLIVWLYSLSASEFILTSCT